MNEKIKIMGEESVPTALLKFGIPAIVGLSITVIYNFVDAIFVGGLGTSRKYSSKQRSENKR